MDSDREHRGLPDRPPSSWLPLPSPSQSRKLGHQGVTGVRWPRQEEEGLQEEPCRPQEEPHVGRTGPPVGRGLRCRLHVPFWDVPVPPSTDCSHRPGPHVRHGLTHKRSRSGAGPSSTVRWSRPSASETDLDPKRVGGHVFTSPLLTSGSVNSNRCSLYTCTKNTRQHLEKHCRPQACPWAHVRGQCNRPCSWPVRSPRL